MRSSFPNYFQINLKNRILLYPLVGLFIPSIFYKKLAFIPYIGKKLPNKLGNASLQSSHGFTLIELVVTMAVAAILVAVAVPNLRTFIQNGRINTQLNDLIGDISLARSEAIKRRSGTGICKSTDGLTCVGGGNWGGGRAVFVDLNNNNLWDAGETILRFRGPLNSATDTLNTNVMVPDPIIFGANGAPTNVLPGGIFVFCDIRGVANSKQLSLNAMGQVAVYTTAPATCTP